MAWVVTRSNGRREVRFQNTKGERKTIRLGAMPKRAADSFAANLSQLIAFLISGRSPEPKIIEWFEALPASLRQRIRHHDIRFGADRSDEVQGAGPITVGQWCDEYLAKRTDLKESTREQFKISVDNLKECFGESKPLESFHAGDGDDFRTWLISTKTLSENTARRRMGRAKQLFNAAVRRKLLAANPFQDQKAAVGSNPKRQQFVPHEWIERCIRKSPCESWRIIIALARYGGLRRDECLQVRWADVDIPAKRFIVRATKTEHCEDGGVRIVPIFPELLPHMMRCKEMAAQGAEFLQSRYKSGDNIGTQFKRIIELAGVMPWPKLFQNLRASRETELLARFPAKDVAAWLGNSVPVAMKHYAMATAESFDRATAEGAKGMEAIVTAARQSAGVSTGEAHPKAHPTAALSSPQQPTAGESTNKKTLDKPGFVEPGVSVQIARTTQHGLEP